MGGSAYSYGMLYFEASGRAPEVRDTPCCKAESHSGRAALQGPRQDANEGQGFSPSGGGSSGNVPAADE